MFCSLMMLIITGILMASRIRTGRALEGQGHFVSISEDPFAFWLFTVLNFLFLIVISVTMMFLSIISSA